MGSEESEKYSYEIVSYTDIWDEHQTPEESPWNFPVPEDELANIDFALIAVTFPNGDVEYRTFADGHWSSYDELTDNIEDWLDGGIS